MPQSQPILVFRDGPHSHWDLKLTDWLRWLVCEPQESFCLCLPSVEITSRHTRPGILCTFWESSQESSTSPTGLFLECFQLEDLFTKGFYGSPIPGLLLSSPLLAVFFLPIMLQIFSVPERPQAKGLAATGREWKV